MSKFDRLPQGYASGRMNELDTFGKFLAKEGYQQALEAVETGEKKYVNHSDSLDLIRRFATEDPTNPTKQFTRELRLAVIDALKLEEDEDLDRVRFFTAVGTPADIFHGIDGWIEYVQPNGKTVLVTLDTSLRKKEEGEFKADFIIPEIADAVTDGELFDSQVATYGGTIAQRIKDNLESARPRRRAA